MKQLPLALAALGLAIGVQPSLAHPHHPLPKPLQVAAATATAAAKAAPDAASLPRVVSGTGAFRYEFAPDRLVLPPQIRMRHGHGLCHDPKGYIYFTYEAEVVGPETRVLVRFDPDGTNPRLLGSDNSLAHGAPHGLSLHVDAAGKMHLYHANNDATVHKTTLEGDVEWTRKWPAFMGNYKPTDAIVPPGSDRLFVADGYGSSMIHLLKTADGVYAGKSWGGTGSAHGELNCPHGLTHDPRRQLLLVADRTNQRLEYYSLKGLYQATIAVPEIKAPCNADVLGDHVLVPNLDGPLVILGKENQALSVIEVGKLLGGHGFKHPHDAIWLPNGDIVVCTWNPGRLGYWRKLPAQGN